MEIRYTYIADDGTEFDNEEECRAYEDALKVSFSSVVIFDENKNILSHDWEEIEGNDFYIVIVDKPEAEKLFDKLSDYISFEKPKFEIHAGDVLAWDLYSEEWFNVHERIEDYMRLIHELQTKAAEVL
ncbi:MAG: hypothetical protein IJI06_04485 [Oscillospiraceae bacterium]|nr:hypothetical protein [Oscillospiraceae bacterium]